MTDLYQRPSRAEIAARVNGETRPDSVDVAQVFIMRTRAALRARGWNQAELARRTGCGGSNLAKIFGSGAPRLSLATAAAIAAALGIPLDSMINPACGTCRGTPPAGFICRECGTEGARP